jgi:thiamine pyrophosphokinase
VLPLGRNLISGIDPKKGLFRKHVGILPIYGPSKITIQGFEWDVQDWETRMGGVVSTSNHILGDEVVVEVWDEMVLFTIELAGSTQD